jgi:hypothetical protein
VRAGGCVRRVTFLHCDCPHDANAGHRKVLDQDFNDQIGLPMNQLTARASVEAPSRNFALKAVKTLLVSEHPTLYALLLLAAILGAYSFSMRAQGIFSCPASGYSSDFYLAYCGAKHFGDYDHGAFWFGLEPEISDSVRSAKVMFLGSSRMQFGFSSDATRNWFAANTASYYLMGFAYWENYLFERELLGRLHPQARVYVINLDTFFENTETAPARIVMHDRDALTRYKQKHDLERVHFWVCDAIPAACGSVAAFFRSRSTGSYVQIGGRRESIPVTYDEVVNQNIVRDYAARAAPFLATLPVDSKCVVLTMVPTVNTPSATAREIARSLGATFIAPKLDNLTTIDASHMSHASAELWSKAFFEAAGPAIRECLDKSGS